MKGRSMFIWIRRAVLFVVAAAVLLQLFFLIQIVWWVKYNPTSTSFMREQLSVLREQNPNATLRHTWVPYDKISISLKRAVITAEDAQFLDHDGVEWDALESAYLKNQKKGKVVAGGSTITQQLAKNLFLSGSRSYLRKGQELIITFMLEAVMDKRRILEIYLNVAEWGVGVFGAEAAARHYYNTSAASLSQVQAARLAVMLPKPRYYDRFRGTAYLERRTGRVLRQMGMVAVPR